MNALQLLVAILAVYRLAILLSQDDGPGDWFLVIRTWLGAYDYERDPTPVPPGEPVHYRPRTNLGRLISCPRCLSVWLALPLAAWLWWGAWPWLVLGWLGLSGGAIWLWEVQNHE